MRRLAWGLGALVVLCAIAIVVGGFVLSGPSYNGPPSDHFDGSSFHNVPEMPRVGLGGFLRWRLTRHARPWAWRQVSPGPPPPRAVARGEMRVTFINHATVLLQMDGLNILTDPIWSERTSPLSFVGPRRFHAPGIRFEDLPPIHAVVISHNHYDHLDLPTLKRLQAAHAPRFFVGLGNGGLLRAAGLDHVTELDWWQSQPLSKDVQLHGVPAQHFSNRGLFDRNTTLWLGYAVQGPAGVAVFAGDSGYGPHYARIRQRFGPVRLAILPIGAFNPRWFMGVVHETPAEALLAQQALGARTALGMHFGTFPLADDAQDEPTQLLQSALASQVKDEGAAGRPTTTFWTLQPGEGRALPAPE